MSRFKTKFFWWLVRLARYKADRVPMMEFIGCICLQEAPLTNNINHVWIAFLDSKPLEIKCKTCGQKMPNVLNQPLRSSRLD